MGGPEGADFGGDGFDPDEVVWVPGVDYVGGWRRATDAGAELLAVFEAAGLVLEGVAVQGHAGSDGAGVVRLRLPVATARAVAELIRAVVGGGGERAAS